MKSDGDFFLGTVVVSAPDYGMALVSTSAGSDNMKDMVICHLPYSDSPMGAMIQQHIQDGSSVICMRSAARHQIGYIIAAINELKEDPSNTLNGRVFYMTNSFTTRDSWEFKAIIEKMKKWGGASFLNHANNVDKDVLPGDVDVTNADGPASVHVGRYLVQVKGSPFAFLDVSSIQNQIRLVASKVSTHTTTNWSQISDDVCVDDTAINAQEAFGLKEGNVLNEDYTDNTEDTLPLYRLQSLKGAAVDGKESLVVGFPFDEENHEPLEKHTDTTEPPILAKERTSLSGEMTRASAKGITSIKSSGLRGILQYPYNTEGVEKTGDLMPRFSSKFEEDKQDAIDEEDRVTDAAINKIIDKLLTGDYLKTLKERLAASGLFVSEKSLHDYMEQPEEGSSGPVETQQYKLPKHIELVDPVTGKTHVYYDSDSFISQEPDGSILICDGYGSEIRMSRGNIYISPALDLFIRPGRDLSTMVPRHQSFDCQGYCTINSMSSVYIRAVHNLQMVGATGENGGTVSLECNNKNTGDKGLMIKGLGNVALVGQNVYLGRNKGTSNSANRVEEPENGGSIIIDACSNGTIMERSGSHVIDSHIFTAFTEGDKANSALSIAGNAISLYTENVIVPAKMILAQVNGTQTLKVVRNGQEVDMQLNTADEPQLIVKGNFGVEGNAKIDGSIVVLAAVIQRTSYFVYQSQIKDDAKVFENINAENSKLNENLTNTPGIKGVVKASKGLYQDKYITENGFSFPEKYGVSPTIVIPGMVWQATTADMNTDISDYVWKEEYMTSIKGSTTATTACYPGWEVWESARVTGRGYTSGYLKDSYVTNTKKETNNG